MMLGKEALSSIKSLNVKSFELINVKADDIEQLLLLV